MHRFGKCSVAVKLTLFEAYRICLYEAGIWFKYKTGS